MNQPDRPSQGGPKRRPFLRWPPSRWVFWLVVASLAWRLLRYALYFPMWGDEAFIAVNFITRSFGELAGPLDHPQIVPAGFLWLQWLISRVVGTGEMALRLLPVGFGIAAVFVFWRFAPRIVGRRQAMAAVAIFAASYYPVRHSVEVKSYSLDLLIALGLLWQAWLMCQTPRSVARWVGFAASGAAAVWFSYPAVFITGGAMFVLAYRLYEERSPAAWYAGWVLAGAGMAGSFGAMWLLVAVGQEVHHEGIHELRGWASAFPPLDSVTGFVAWFFRAHTGNMFAYPIGGNHGGSTATFGLIVFGVIALWRTGHRLALALLLSPFPLMFIAAVLKKYPYGDTARVLQHIAPAVCLIAGAGLVAVLHLIWKERGAVSGMKVACMVLFGVIAYGVIQDVRAPYKKESDRVALELARDLADRSGPGDTWVVFGSLGGTDYAPDFLPWGGSLARFRYDLLQYRPDDVPIQWGPSPNDVPAPGPDASTWLIVYKDNDRQSNPFPKERADRYLEAVAARLGVPASESHDLKEDEEVVEIYRFTAPSPAGPADG